MFKSSSFLIIAVIILSNLLCHVVFSSDTQEKTFKEAFQSALERSETLEIQKEVWIQSQEVEDQAKGAILPSINGTATFLQQESPTTSVGSSLYPSNQNTGKITASQPLFRGLRDFAALRQRKYLVQSQKQALWNAARQLFYDLSTAYYNVLAYQKDVENYQLEININQKRLNELNKFYKIGRSQLTDVLTLKANILSLEAQLEYSRGLYENSKEILAYLTGWNRNMSLMEDDIPYGKKAKSIKLLNPLNDVSAYLSKIDDRADVQAAIENLKANEEGINIAWGGHLPSLDLLGDYYLFRPGALSNVTWDISLVLSIPIFQGGIVQSQVRQAESVSRQYSAVLSQVRRLAEREIRTYYDAVVAGRKQISKLAELVDVAKKNYETEVKYYRNGLVTNLDVLQSINTYQDAIRQLDHSRSVFQSSSINLEAAVGARPELSNIDFKK